MAPAFAEFQVWLLGPRATTADLFAELGRGKGLSAANKKKPGWLFPLCAILTIMANGVVSSAPLLQRLEFGQHPHDRSIWILKASNRRWLVSYFLQGPNREPYVAIPLENFFLSLGRE